MVLFRSKPKQGYKPEKRYTPEEFVILDQEKSQKRWNGILLSELSKLAQTTYRGKYVKVDQWGLLVFHYTSNSGKKNLQVQCDLDDNNLLRPLLHNHFPGQWTNSADEFIDKANQQFRFIK